MTTLRERLEHGQYDYVREFLLTHKEQYPMCCFESKTKYLPITRKRIVLFKCYSLNRWYTWKGFQKKCKECVEFMKGILSLDL